MAVKLCGVCRKELPASLEYFHAHKRMPSGMSSFCKVCAKDRSRKWHNANKERAAARAGAYYASHKDEIKGRTAKWYRDNHQSALAYMEKRRSEKPEIVKAAIRKWWKDNPEHGAAIRRGYKARKRNASGKHTGADIKQLFADQCGLCAACKTALSKYHVDHVMPLILGGSNDKSNLQLLCPTCNMSKGGKHPSEWRDYGRQAPKQ